MSVILQIYGIRTFHQLINFIIGHCYLLFLNSPSNFPDYKYLMVYVLIGAYDQEILQSQQWGGGWLYCLEGGFVS